MLIVRKKTALVTGAGSQIANAVIDELCKTHMVRKHRLHATDGFLHGDLSKECNAIDALSGIQSLDTLVCCAGGIKTSNARPRPDDCLNISGENALALFDNNFFSTFFICKHAVPIMNKGNIIIIGSAV